MSYKMDFKVKIVEKGFGLSIQDSVFVPGVKNEDDVWRFQKALKEFAKDWE